MSENFFGARKFFSILFSLALFAFSLTHAVFAQDYSSPSFIIREPVIGGGGASASSPSFQLNEGLGEIAGGLSNGLTFNAIAGLFPFITISAPSAPPTPPTGGPGGVGGGGVLGFRPAVAGACDFNVDGKCNIVDLSILLYHYGHSGPTIARYDLNHDNKIDFVDVSVLFYYWLA